MTKKEKKSIGDSHAFKQDFSYKHKNPYHDKLSAFDKFVLRDNEPESFKGKWNIEVFQRNAPIHFEIGSGYGHFMVDYCKRHPHINFIGMDYRFKRSFNLARNLSKLDEDGLNHFRYIRGKGERTHFLFDENEVSKIFYFFPDPWQKTKHRKKRLFQKPFLESAFRVLNTNGKLLVKTDHDDYFEWMLNELKDQNLFKINMKTFDLHGEFPQHFLSQFITKFEKIFLAKNIKIKALELEVNK